MAEHQQNQPNQTLDRRREERATEQMIQESTNRLASIAADQMEVWQKQLALGSSIAYFWGDAFSATQNSINQLITKVQDSSRKAA